MNGIIPYGRQYIDEEDIQAVIDTLKSDFLTQGPKIAQFETAFSDYLGVKYAIAVANGTAALHLSAIALGVQPGQKVITTPISFVASANCIRYCGGQVIFADIDPNTYLIDLNCVEDLLKKEKNISGIIPVDFAGYPVNMEDVKSLASRYNLWILEDSCHAPGGYFKDSANNRNYCGNGRYADLSIFSFHPVKHIATGEGGMITTNSKKLFDKVSLLRTHGIARSADALQENHGGWYYEMIDLGFNYRLTDMQAALGLSQLKKLDINLQRRNLLALRYLEAFKNIPVETSRGKNDVFHAYHLFVMETDQRKELYDFLRSHGINSQVHYLPIHLHPYYRKLGWKNGDFPAAEKYYSRCLSLPLYYSLTDNQQEYVIEKVLEFYSSKPNT